MKVLHIESGLGNQMLDYCDLLAERQTNPEHEIYIENMIFDIKDAHGTICMWNGYELDRVFGIQEKNVKSLFTDDQWERIISSVTASKFWLDNWRYSDAICDALAQEGLVLKNIHSRPHLTEVNPRQGNFGKSFVGYTMKRFGYQLLEDRIVKEQNLFVRSDSDDFTGHTLRFNMRKSGIEKIDAQIRKSFAFPQITDSYNLQMAEKITGCNSVAIHARRGDMLSANGHFYRYGYFKRAVRFIKKNVTEPVFFFFCDGGSIDWVKGNADVFGLDARKDKIVYVTENTAENSFRDMQLMAMCKHAVVTNSSFGFWGAYLNENPDKITCSPDIRYNTTHHF